MRGRQWFLIVALLLPTACSNEGQESLRSHRGTDAPAPAAETENEIGLNLTQSECSVAANIARVTASPSGQLFINSPDVLTDPRAKVVNGVPGKWSFAYAIREILELPPPGTNPTLLAAEQAKVNQFVNFFVQTAPVNSFVPQNRVNTRTQLLASWTKVRGTDNLLYLTFAGAPFKLVGIVNRLDIVKKGKTAATAGEGRFIYGFTGSGQMTVIMEYDLAIGTASNKGLTSALTWANRWQSLKTFLTDTNATTAGTQPNQTVGAPLSFSNKAGYLAALEAITELWANRNAQTRVGGTQAAISQIRTNEFLSSPWELREMIRTRNATTGAVNLALTTVKNNPDKSYLSGAPMSALGAFIDTNVVCSGATTNTCSYNSASGMLPAALPSGAALLGAASPENFTTWLPSRNLKRNFFALNTCDGCHTTETGTSFVHVSPSTGAASQFLKTDLVARLQNFKNLVCLATANVSGLNLTTDEDQLNSMRIDISNSTH